MQGTMRNSMPIEVRGIRRTTVGTEAAEKMKRVKFKHKSTRSGKEHKFLRLALEDAISESFCICRDGERI